METKFQTSFIPKRPIPGTSGNTLSGLPHKNFGVGGGGASIFFTISIVLFVLSLLSIAGAYVGKLYFLKNQATLKQELVSKQKQFKIDQISLMKAQSSKISLGKQLLNNHLAVSKLYNIFSKLTAELVRFTTLDVSVPVGSPGPIQISLSGYGKDYMTVAFQSDVINELEKYNLRNIVQNPVLSDPSLNQNGTVSFGFTAEVDSSGFTYARSLNIPSSVNIPVDTQSASTTLEQ